MTIKPTKEEVAICRELRTRAALAIREGKTDITMNAGEFSTAFLFEEMHLMNMNNGKPVTAVYYGLRVKHDTAKPN